MENKKNHPSAFSDEVKENDQVKPDAQETIILKMADYLQLKQEADQAKEARDKLVRFQADFDNARKRWERDRNEWTLFANEDLICDVLTIVDELERSVELSKDKHEDHVAFLTGVEMILAHLHDLLKKNGVAKIAAEGKCFDPNFHEALMQMENDDLPEHTVVEEMQKGYTLNDKVIRTAKVQVSKKKKEIQEQ